MADRFAAGMDDDEVVAALNALAAEIQQKQDNIDNLGGEVTTLRTEKATLAGEVATIRTEKATLETTVATLRREKDVLAADLVTLERNHVILQADHILLQRATNNLTAESRQWRLHFSENDSKKTILFHNSFCTMHARHLWCSCPQAQSEVVFGLATCSSDSYATQVGVNF